MMRVQEASDFSDEKTLKDWIAGRHGPTLVVNEIRKAMKWVNHRGRSRRVENPGLIPDERNESDKNRKTDFRTARLPIVSQK